MLIDEYMADLTKAKDGKAKILKPIKSVARVLWINIWKELLKY